MTSPEPERLTVGDCARLLGLRRRTVWWWHKLSRFAEPIGTLDGHAVWAVEDLYEWAVQQPSSRGLHAQVPLEFWPPADEPVPYLRSILLDGAVAQLWRTDAGVVALLWGLPGQSSVLSELAEELYPIVAIVRVEFDFGHDGPALTTYLPARPERAERYGLSWSELSSILGQPLPYWPPTLRSEDLLMAWRPGQLTRTAPAVPDIDTGALLRLAAVYDDHQQPAAQVLVNLARTSQDRSTCAAREDLELLAQEVEPDPGTIMNAAVPMDTPTAALDDLELTTRRAGWLDILARTDTLAAQCVMEALRWNGGQDFPFSNPEAIDISRPAAKEWAGRLQPSPRTAAFELLGSDRQGEVFVDPMTDAPVVRDERRPQTLYAAIPQRLPTTSPLAEIIIDRPIWVRTQDGALYPAPKDSYYGISWGYGGSGPGTLALLIDRLLDDITAQAPAGINGAPMGLQQLTKTKWPSGTVLRRGQLEAARRGEWIPMAIADGDDDHDSGREDD